MTRQPDVEPVSDEPSSLPTAGGDEAESSPLTDQLTPPESDVTPETSAEAADDLPPAFRLIHTRGGRFGKQPNRASSPVVWLTIVCLGVGILGGYLLPRAGDVAAKGVASSPNEEIFAPLTPAEVRDLDTAYTLRRDGKFEEAEQLFASLARGRKEWGVLNVEAGRTLLYAGNFKRMGAVLDRAIEKGSTPAEAHFLLAARQLALKNFPEAEASFASAVALDPTEPNYYYCWGECLRGQGKLLEAIEKFRSALLRNQYETATGLYRLKLWLSQIEADQESPGGVSAEIDAALAQPYPPMEALFAAAARTLKAGDLKLAASQISHARQTVDPTIFHVIISDPFFRPIRADFTDANLISAAPAAVGAGERTTSDIPSPTPPMPLEPSRPDPSAAGPPKTSGPVVSSHR